MEDLAWFKSGRCRLILDCIIKHSRTRVGRDICGSLPFLHGSSFTWFHSEWVSVAMKCPFRWSEDEILILRRRVETKAPGWRNECWRVNEWMQSVQGAGGAQLPRGYSSRWPISTDTWLWFGRNLGGNGTEPRLVARHRIGRFRRLLWDEILAILMSWFLLQGRKFSILNILQGKSGFKFVNSMHSQ